MPIEMARCEHCSQLIPVDRLGEHLLIHEKYGTASHRQEPLSNRPQQDPEPVIDLTLKEVPEQYGDRDATIPASPRISKVVEQDRDVTLQPEIQPAPPISKPEEEPTNPRPKSLEEKFTSIEQMNS